MSAQLSLEQYERINPALTVNHNGQQVHYGTPNSMTAWRVKSIFDKEPDTMAWLETFTADDIMLDVGANVGMYSIWAAKIAGTRVFAFEPESQNFAQLCRNIALNQLDNMVTAYCLALSDETKLDILHLSQFAIGGSCHSFKDCVDFHLKERGTAFEQGCFAMSYDQLIAEQDMPVPTRIKIDVDGIEHKVIAGLQNTLENSVVKDVLIEINTNIEEHASLIEHMRSLNFEYDEEDTNKYIRKEGAFTGVGNFIFKRSET
ncbi:MAG: FkbM family methyltransferase [Rickettsiales bacterium]|nr:FkbM family methyltransferase [Rickettsiales bacterium]